MQNTGKHFIFCFFIIVVFIASGCKKTDIISTTLNVRKNVTALTPQEKADFVNAIKLLKQTPSPYDANINYYDQFVKWHYEAFYCDGSGMMLGYPAHMNPAFLPWHRSYLQIFENALSTVSGKNILIPYWDWTDPSSLNVVFADDFMGGFGNAANGYVVETGPFRQGQWEVKITDYLNIDSVKLDIYPPINANPDLIRAESIFKTGTVSLPKNSDLLRCLNVPTYDCYPWDSSSDTLQSFRNTLEGWRGSLGNICTNNNMDVDNPTGRTSAMHNVVHLYVGGVFPLAGGGYGEGNMAQNTSPNDPVFWIHHANIDRIWTGWMNRHGRVYLPENNGPMQSNLNDVMEPFSFRTDGKNTPKSMLYETDLGYRYDVLP
ncbi:MAG: tyrosinase family protein [Bacteroidota bacterium]